MLYGIATHEQRERWNMFTWIPIHREAIHKILLLQQADLLAILRDMQKQELKVISLEDQDSKGHAIPLAEIDPFTFLATFNRGVTENNRRENWKFLKEKWGLKEPVPDDFTGIPVYHNLSSWLFPYAFKRDKQHMPLLWKLAASAADGNIQQVDQQLFDDCLDLRKVAISSLTIGLFWINPKNFLPADHKTTTYGQAKGVAAAPCDYASYEQWVGEMNSRLGSDNAHISHSAELFARSPDDADDPEKDTKPAKSQLQYWTFSAGRGGERWEEFFAGGIMAIGWKGTPDLRHFASKEDIRKKLVELEPDGSSKSTDALACWQFVHDIKKGDVIFAKQGLTRLLGYGFVQSDYKFDPALPDFRHTRQVKWKTKNEWELPEGRMALKTLTDITSDRGLVKLLAQTVGLELIGEDSPGPPSYWWLNANPAIWDFEQISVGERQIYTSHNHKGHRRQKYKYFQEVKPGDIVVGYVTNPQKALVAVCRITKGLHEGTDGEQIEFEKIERLEHPVPVATLRAVDELAQSEPLTSVQGSLFRLADNEFEIIRSLIDETNIPPAKKPAPYTRQDAMADLFLSESQFDEMLAALRDKKNVVLQGAPGVGKTYVAKRLAYAFIGMDDPRFVEMIQFHQSYSYEDFVQGFRPTAKGHFDLRNGVFHYFCARARRDESADRPYVLIIDEINRGNLSKIFGELMMLIEPDKRGHEHGMPLTYAEDSSDKFYVPENLYLIGMMNTADRSLAMVDYALRRRFRFITLRPEFVSTRFRAFLIDMGAAGALVDKIVDRMTALNDIIAADTRNLGPGYQIGHSYFCPRKGIVPDDEWYRRVIESEIVPLIEEYWFDNEQKVKERRAALLA
jgi:5-methylcytosine-specific restriction protein B